MSNLLWKKLHLCFSSSRLMKSSSPSSTLSPSSKPDNHSRPSHTPSIFINNFNFLYDHLSSPRHYRSNSLGSAFTTANVTATTTTTDSSSVSSDGDTESYPAGFAAVFAARRFLSCPPETISADSDDDDRAAVSQLISRGVAVMKHVDSPDPYRDFRRSMQEMVEARNLRNVRADREFLHELLFCYLSLNPKHIHKFIISAFADTLVSLLSDDSRRGSD